MARQNLFFCNGVRIGSMADLYDNFNFEDLKNSLTSGKLQLWLTTNGFSAEYESLKKIDCNAADADMQMMQALNFPEEKQKAYLEDLQLKKEEAERKAKEEAERLNAAWKTSCVRLSFSEQEFANRLRQKLIDEYAIPALSISSLEFDLQRDGGIDDEKKYGLFVELLLQGDLDQFHLEGEKEEFFEKKFTQANTFDDIINILRQVSAPQQILQISDNCIGCLRCKGRCPVEAISGNDREKPHIDFSKCTGCGTCIVQCPKHAIISVSPSNISADQVRGKATENLFSPQQEQDSFLTEIDATLAEAEASQKQNEKILAEIDQYMAHSKDIHRKVVEKHREVLRKFKQDVAANRLIYMTSWGRGNNGDVALCLLSKELTAIAAEILPIPENQKKYIAPNFFIKDWYFDHGISHLEEFCKKIAHKYVILLDENDMSEKVETFHDLVVLVKEKLYEEI